MQKASSAPKLRFPEFLDEWRVLQLGDCAEVDPKTEKLPEYFTYIDLDSVNDGILTKVKLISKTNAPSRAQRVLKHKDILFQTVRPYQQNNLFFRNWDGEYVASTGYAQIRAREDSMFLYQYLHTNRFVSRVLTRCTGTNYPAINSSDLVKISISLPAICEQQKIAEFLTAVEKKIEAMRKRIDLLKQYKKGVMQAIFSRTFRFKNENGNDFPDWEEKKLGDIATIKTGNLNVQDATDNGEFAFFDRSEEIKKYNEYTFNNEALIYSGEGSEFLPRYFNGKYGLHQRSYTIFDAKGVGVKYLYYFLLTQNKHFLRMAVGSTVKSLRMDCFHKCQIPQPSNEEQQKIADFLTSLDDKINLEAKKLEQAKWFKKSLLQQMFV